MVQTPDTIYAFVKHLRGDSVNIMPQYAPLCSDLHALVAPDWIGTYIPDTNQMPRGCIVVQGAGGFGRLADGVPGLLSGRALIRCYHPDAMWGARMATLVRWLILPVEQGVQGWDAAGSRIIDVSGMTAPTPLVDPVEKWEYRDAFVEYRAYERVMV